MGDVCRLVAAGNAGYFTDEAGSLWRTDGTEAGTVRVKPIPEGPGALFDPTAFGGALFFRILGDRDTLWKTDGTEAGTVPIADLAAKGILNRSTVTAVFQGHLYFVSFAEGGDDDSVLWKTDGTRTGTAKVKHLLPQEEGVEIERMFADERALFLLVRRADRAVELWRSDGTEGGTVFVKRLRPPHPPARSAR
jgi:ELWxxDGT repeat protein